MGSSFARSEMEAPRPDPLPQGEKGPRFDLPTDDSSLLSHLLQHVYQPRAVGREIELFHAQISIGDRLH